MQKAHYEALSAPNLEDFNIHIDCKTRYLFPGMSGIQQSFFRTAQNLEILCSFKIVWQ